MAPASLALSTRSRWLKAVSITTGAIRADAIRWAAAMPSRRGIFTSRITRSGRSSSVQAAGGGADRRGARAAAPPCATHRHDVVPLLVEHLGEVHPDQCLVL